MQAVLIAVAILAAAGCMLRRTCTVSPSALGRAPMRCTWLSWTRIG